MRVSCLVPSEDAVRHGTRDKGAGGMIMFSQVWRVKPVRPVPIHAADRTLTSRSPPHAGSLGLSLFSWPNTNSMSEPGTHARPPRCPIGTGKWFPSRLAYCGTGHTRGQQVCPEGEAIHQVMVAHRPQRHPPLRAHEFSCKSEPGETSALLPEASSCLFTGGLC